MKRSKHSLSHYVLTTFDMGQLVPICNFEVLPGDTVQMSTSGLIRLSPLVKPVMHPVQVRIHHWFVPYRILWSQWEDFITGGSDGLGNGAVYPTYNIGTTGNVGQLHNYLGVPPNGNAAITVSALPNRAYYNIWNDYYRDQDLETALSLDTLGAPQRVSWEKDQFTAARPWTQKGPTVTIPLGTSATVRTNATDLVTGAQAQGVRFLQTPTGAAPANNLAPAFGGGTGAFSTGGAASTAGNALYPSNLFADLAAVTGVPVNTVRAAMALQRYQEARAQYGSRYVEYLRYLGVRSSDARLQNPEYLGGGRATISFSEVLRTATTAAAPEPVGDMNGHGIAGVRTRQWTRFFEEHGVVMTLASLRPKTVYANSLHKKWSRRTKEDYWQRELELIGQEEVRNKEVYAPHGTPEGVFGYNDRYYSYRHHPSYITGEFQTTENDWHLARIFGAPPALNAAFVQCDPGIRPFADQTAADKLYCMFNHNIRARRMVGNRTIGRIM